MIPIALLVTALRAVSLVFGASGMFMLWASFYVPFAAAHAIALLGMAAAIGWALDRWTK